MAINVLSSRAADNFRIMRSGKITLSADDTYQVIKIPKKAFVVGVWLEILTAFDDQTTDGTITVGFSGNGETADADYFMDNSAAAPLVTGMKEVTKGKWFGTSSGLITVTANDNDSTVDPVIRVWVVYSVIH